MSGVKPVVFLREVRGELTKVDWPTRDQTIRLTAIVVAVSVFTALFLGGFDFIFTKLTELVLTK